MTIKHLLCDLDETLLHTLSTTKNAYDCVFDSLNMPRKTAAEIKKATGGKPKSEIFGYMLCGETFAAGEPYSLQTKKGLRTLNQKQMEETMSLAHDTFYNYIEQNHIRDASLVEGALTLLSYCQKNEVRLHIISSKSPEYLEQELDHFNLTPFLIKYTVRLKSIPMKMRHSLSCAKSRTAVPLLPCLTVILRHLKTVSLSVTVRQIGIWLKISAAAVLLLMQLIPVVLISS